MDRASPSPQRGGQHAAGRDHDRVDGGGEDQGDGPKSLVLEKGRNDHRPGARRALPQTYAFGALRCSDDNVNGDNVEYKFASGGQHVYCFAYYVVPPPTSGKIEINKQVSDPPNGAELDVRREHLLHEPSPVQVEDGQRRDGVGERLPRRTGLTDPAWTVTEIVPAGWRLTDLDCTAGGSIVPRGGPERRHRADRRRHRNVHVHRRIDAAARQPAAVQDQLRRP